MTSLPADRHGLGGAAQAGPRQFARDEREVFGGTDASWTAAPRSEEGAGDGAGGGGGPARIGMREEPDAGRPMSLAEAAALARANAAAGKRPQPPSRATAAGVAGGEGAGGEGAKSLVDVHKELKAKEKKAKKGGAEWAGSHPWKPWNRETDLDIRQVQPKGIDSVLKNQHMGELSSRFGSSSRETTFM